jgi:predicted transcriptional regulator
MLSLPENWDFSINGLAEILPDGRSSVAEGLRKLEKCGYLTREKKRDEKGKIIDVDYIIYDESQIYGAVDNPYVENQGMDCPDDDYPHAGNRIQSINNQSITKQSNTNQSIRAIDDDLIKANISFEKLIAFHHDDEKLIVELVSIMTDIATSKQKSYTISGKKYPSQTVKNCILSLKYENIEYVLDSLNSNTSHIRNVKAYLTSTLFNSKSESNYSREVKGGIKVKKNTFNSYEQRDYEEDELEEIIKRKNKLDDKLRDKLRDNKGKEAETNG